MCGKNGLPAARRLQRPCPMNKGQGGACATQGRYNDESARRGKQEKSENGRGSLSS